MFRRLRRVWNGPSATVAICLAGLALLYFGGMSHVIRERKRSALMTARVTTALVGRAAPALRTVDGSDTLVIAPQPNVSLLIMFVTESCAPCQDLLTETKRMLASPAQVADWPDMFVAALDAKQVPDPEPGKGLHIVSLADPEAVTRAYRVLAVPYLALIDASGRVAKVQVGYSRHSTLQRFLATRPASD